VDFAYDLGPGESYFITETVVVTQNVANSATWTATDGTYTAEAADTASVTVYQPFFEVFLPIIGKNW
jgi:hypothetical protein